MYTSGVEIIIFAVAALFGLFFLATIFLPLRLLKGKARILLFAGVLCFWGYQYWHRVRMPEAQRAWRAEGHRKCSEELSSLPKTVEARRVLDEGAAIRDSTLLALFRDRGLEMVEVQVGRNVNGVPYVTYPDGEYGESWWVRGIRTPYARLSLQNASSPHCVAAAGSLARRVNMPPFLPDTCLALEEADAATAEFAITQLAAADPDARQHGRWAIVDRATNTTVASLTTNDGPQWPSAARAFESLSTGVERLDCRSPHSVLVERFNREPAPGASRRNHAQLLEEARVVATPPVDLLDASETEQPTLRPRVEPIYFSDEEERALFSPGHDGWRAAYEQARASGGLAPYSRRVLDLRRRTIVELKPTSKARPYPWETFAVVDGFIALSTASHWRQRASNLVAKYAIDGTLVWVARVASPPAPNAECQHASPQAVLQSRGELSLVFRCATLTGERLRLAPKENLGEVWRLRTTSLPGAQVQAPRTP